MNRRVASFVGLLLTALCFGQSVYANQAPLYYLDHPLVGKVFSASDRRWVTESHLIGMLQDKQFILLGESHTNPVHHAGQARLIERWLKAEKPTALVLEMLAYGDESPANNSELTLEALTTSLEEVARGWQWHLYAPLLALHLKHQLPLHGGNLVSAQKHDFSSGQSCQLSRQDMTIDVCDLFASSQQKYLQQLIFAAHCDYLPMAQTPPLMRIQIAKDASLAMTMAEMGDSHQVALIAGAIHVRKDIGVPVHLHKLGYSPETSVASVAFVNVQPEKLQVDDYFDEVGVADQYDYVIFTASERNQDPCIEFSEQLRKMKKTDS